MNPYVPVLQQLFSLVIHTHWRACCHKKVLLHLTGDYGPIMLVKMEFVALIAILPFGEVFRENLR
ncbi:hypothetical protein SAMN05216420_11840 [Nitrosospira sp. Nl5]|nr:hypothetical protein SAMN05216420_11840 [Nitrosospira sp. Nl5]